MDIGADENNSCDSGNQDDIFNDLDWNLDGTVDSYELVVFADAWLSHDPNDPGIITDPNFAGDPGYADPETLAMWRQTWDPLYNLDGDYDVDYGDFVVFGLDWLWRTCWKQSWLDLMETMAVGGGMGRMMGGESMLISEPAAEQISKTPSEPSVAEQIKMVKECLEFWYREDVREGIEDKDIWLKVVTSLEEMLEDLQAEY